MKKNNMITLIIVGIIGALLFMGMWWFFDNEPVLYENKTENIGGATAPNHIVSIDSASFLKAFSYASPHNITVSDTIKMMINDWPGRQSIVWRPMDIDSPNVSINLIRKTSSNPIAYELVRVITPSTPNSGGFTWIIDENDIKPDTYIEIGCVSSDTECRSLPVTISL